MVPAWCHLCWHLELTAWKVHSGALLRCLKPLLQLRASSPTSAGPISHSHQPVVHLLPSAPTVYRAKSAAVSYPNPPIFSRSLPLRTNRLLRNLPGLQRLPSKRLGTDLSQGMLFRSSWSTGTEHLWSRRLDKMTSRDPCQTVCFYQSDTLKKHWISSKLNFRRDSSDSTGVILYGISKLTKLLHRKSARNLFCWLGVGVFIAAPSWGSCCFTCTPENSTIYTWRSCAM